jgi:DNA-binding CsgD family transcriptional regulator/N-acetylneuraminic acid mutarotase
MAEYGEPLSQREREVLELVTTGATNRQVAQELVVSVNTVKVHLRNIFTKLGVESRTEATLTAIREGWVGVPTEAAETESGIDAPAPTATQAASELVQSQKPTPPPIPWPKRLTLVFSLLLVTLVSAVTWPRPQTTAAPSSRDQETGVNGPGMFGLEVEGSKWRILAPMTTGRSRFALVAAPDGQLFAIGGNTNGGATGAVERYDPAADQWEPLTASKPTRVSNIDGAAIGEWIYVPGGRTAEGEPTSIVEAYNVANEVWSQVAPLPRPLYAYALAVYGGRLYVFGGRDDRGYANTTYIYDPAQDTWQAGKEMRTQRAYAAAATLGSQVFVVGGYDGQREQSTCEIFNPEEGLWETCEPLILDRSGFGLAGVANRLYAVGGGWSNYLVFSEEYSLEATDWTHFETPISRQWQDLAVASTANSFYVAGGWNGEYLNGLWEYVVLEWRIYIPAASP